LQRLSSGLRINSAKDDAAGLAISTRFTSQIKGLDVAVRNAGDGIALAQTAEGALGSINESLQRIRELAVQSANATNSDVDREALQAEVDQLVSEISRTADETDFNGRKLLDGSFAATFQIGANAGQTVDISIAELTADKLGASDASGLSARGTNASLENGDLVINGVNVPASKAESDNASVNNNGASAIAKVAAINSVSDQTGVKAFVNENVVAGTSQNAQALNGKIYLNGAEIDIQTTDNAASSRASVVEAINAVSAQTGVTAVDSGADSGGVSLVAEDGRNITLGFDTVGTNFGSVDTATVAAATGLALGGEYNTSTNAFTTTGASQAGTDENAGTYEGGYTLVADGDVKSIDISGGDGTGNGDIANAGLVNGSFDSGAAFTTSESQTESGSFGTIENNLADGDVVNTAAANDTANPLNYSVQLGDSVVANDTLAAASTVGALAKAINDSDADIVAFEEIKLTIDASTLATGETLTFTAGGGNTATASYSGATAGNLETLADDINNAAYAGSGLDVAAEFDGTNILVTIKNFNADEVTVAASANDVDAGPAGSTETVGTTALGATGDIKFRSLSGQEVQVTVTDPLENETLFDTSSDGLISDSYSGVNGLSDGDLTINGVAISEAQVGADTASATFASDGSSKIVTSDKSLSGIAIAASINEVSEETGVTAVVNETSVVGGDGTNADATKFDVGDQAGLYINGVSIGTVTLQADGGGAIDTDKAKSDAIAAINQASGQTGVTAEDNGVSITLTAADGRNISVAIDDEAGRSDASIGALFGLDAAVDGIGEATFAGQDSNSLASSEAQTYETTYSTVELKSASEINIQAGSNGRTELEAVGFTTGKFGGGESGQFLKDIDISTFEGAQAAITAIDNAIGQVASQRADLGAIQNRLESTVSNLQVTSENLNAANSRIQDADFAAETAELSRTQVLQQAGISVLAQANAAGQQVLSLLG
jgi:flagellin